MHLHSTFYFQTAINHSSLLLQHYQVDSVPICFACICSAEDPAMGRAAGYLTKQLLHWFRDLPWRKLSRDPERHLLRIETKLQRVIEHTIEELKSSNLLSLEEQLSFAGIFCVGEYFLLFCQGTPGIYLLNRNFGRGALQCISDNLSSADGTIAIHQGVLETDIGLLLATATFCSNVDRQELKDCLYVKEVQTEDRARRHLQELGCLSEARGGCHMGAILILTMAADEESLS